jgi:hypothetical protein
MPEKEVLVVSFPKIPSTRGRAVRQNQRIIRYDACDTPAARDDFKPASRQGEIETMVAAANTVKPISHAKNIPLRGHGALWQPINGGSDGPRQLL